MDASNASWGFRDVRVTVRSAAVAPVELLGPNGAKRKTREPYLQLSVRVANGGVERRIGLTGWAAGAGPIGLSLTDPGGKPLRPASFDPGWGPAGPGATTDLSPGKAAEVLFTFDPPPGRVEYLRLDLPGPAAGVDEPIRFRIPGSILAHRRRP